MALLYEAKMGSIAQGEKLWQLIDERFRAAVASNTNSSRILYQWGKATYQRALLAKRMYNHPQYYELLKLAAERCYQAVRSTTTGLRFRCTALTM